MTNPLGIAVLAAGEGTRMRSALNKMLHPLCGRPLLRLVLDLADTLAGDPTVLVLGPTTLGPLREALGARYGYVEQHERLGTGHALRQAEALLRGRTNQVLVLYGDTPLLRAETVRALCMLQQHSGALAALLSFHTATPTGYGRVLRDEAGRVLRLVEERNATPEQRAISECNSGIYCFAGAWLWEALARVQLNPLKGEYYLTDLVELAVADAGPGAAVALVAQDPSEAFGVNDRAQLAEAEALLRQRLLGDLMCAGVTITDPSNTYVDLGVQVGQDTTLLPGTLLLGNTIVGARCVIGPHTQLRNASVGDGATVRFALVEEANVPAEAMVGPFVHLNGGQG